METLGMMLYRIARVELDKRNYFTPDWDKLPQADKDFWQELGDKFAKELA